MAKKIDYIIDEWDVLMPRTEMPIICEGKIYKEEVQVVAEGKTWTKKARGRTRVHEKGRSSLWFTRESPSRK